MIRSWPGLTAAATNTVLVGLSQAVRAVRLHNRAVQVTANLCVANCHIIVIVILPLMFLAYCISCVNLALVNKLYRATTFCRLLCLGLCVLYQSSHCSFGAANSCSWAKIIVHTKCCLWFSILCTTFNLMHGIT